MTTLLLTAVTLAAPPDPGWRFVDEAAFAGRSAVTFRSVELAGRPTKPLHKDDAPPAGAAFGSVPLGSGRVRLAVVWHAASGTVWLDADGDGRFAAAERHTLGPTPLAVPVQVPNEDKPLPRTLLVRRRGDGLAAGVRGYTTGTATVGGKAVTAALTDGDGDGHFAAAGADRVWLDLDGDGAFDPLAEQFPLGTVIAHRGSAFLIRPRADGLGVEVRERPAETGTLTVRVNAQPGAEVVELAAQYVSEWGELVVVRAAGEPVPVPAGRYRVESVRLALLGLDGKRWRYTFASADRAGYAVTVAKGAAATHAPLDGLRASATVDAADPVPAGGSVQVYPDVTAGPLYLTGCEAGDRFADHGREVQADVVLAGPGSVAVDRFASGFA